MMSSIADVDTMMYECGVEILHPGGLEKSDEMARACGVGNDKFVLDVGAGRGTTACHLAREYGCRVVGTDLSSAMTEAASRKAEKEGVGDLASFRVADAYALPFDDESFDAVLVECVTTLLDRSRAFPELVRVLKRGGRLGDLEMIYKKKPPEEFARRLRERWGGFTTMALDGWKKLLERHGMEVVQVDDFSDLLADFSRAMMKEMGLKGCIKLAWKLLLRGDLRRSMMEYARIFREGEEIFGYAYVVGGKP